MSATLTTAEEPAILLIDDDASVRALLTLLLELRGIRVLTAADGRRGLQAFREHAPAVVVTDIMMPEQDGIGVMLQMQRERSDVKIVAMSAGGKIDQSDYLSVAKKLGAVSVFEKSADTMMFVEMLVRLVKGTAPSS
jgi:DNA-binding NtrC family response regulator